MISGIVAIRIAARPASTVSCPHEIRKNGSALPNSAAKQITTQYPDSSASRCPANATCVWEGEATAHFTLYEDGEATPFTLTMPGLVTEVQDMERYQFQRVGRFVAALLLLQPYPELAEEEGMAPTATLELRRLTR